MLRVALKAQLPNQSDSRASARYRPDAATEPVPGGPILVFDKSALQSFSADESVLFDNFYPPVVTPLFFVETLAELDK